MAAIISIADVRKELIRVLTQQYKGKLGEAAARQKAMDTLKADPKMLSDAMKTIKSKKWLSVTEQKALAAKDAAAIKSAQASGKSIKMTPPVKPSSVPVTPGNKSIYQVLKGINARRDIKGRRKWT